MGDTKITFYKAPGHTPDGLFAIVEPLGLLIAGDYLSDIEFPFIFHSSEAYEDTLYKVESILNTYSINILVPGHGQTTDSIEEMKRRQREALDYIQTLRKAISEKKQELLDGMIEEFPFYKGVKENHQHNQKLIQKELKAL